MTDTCIPDRYILGSDNAMAATGLCLVRWHPVSGGKVLWSTTLTPRCIKRKPDVCDFTARLKDALHSVADVLGLNNLDLLSTEGAFAKGGRRSLAGIDVAKSGGIVIGMVRYLWSCPVITMQAAPVDPRVLGWRKAFGLSNPADADASVKQCGYLFHEDGGIGGTQHEWEAYGIACGGARAQFDREAIR